jgi:XTP/dITP diphosphohydrolase
VTQFVLASGNRHKIDEFRAILASMRDVIGEYTFSSMAEIGFTSDIVEDGETFEENALIKARAIAALGYIAIADDSGLCVNALGGAPGIHSARYSGAHGNDENNNSLLLKNMENCADRSAYYVCAIACAFPDGRSFTVRGECHGELLTAYRGEGRFGYDPLFLYTPMQKTFAEMSMQEKNAVSHRGVAAKEFTKILPKYL